MLDKPEVLAEVTEQPRFLPWEINTIQFFLKHKVNTESTILYIMSGLKSSLVSLWHEDGEYQVDLSNKICPKILTCFLQSHPK